MTLDPYLERALGSGHDLPPHPLPQLDPDSSAQLARRISVGRNALNAMHDDNDDETTAADLISDVLTALYGPAGYSVPTSADDFEQRWREEALTHAQQILDRGFRSWEGDAEDYSA